MTLSDFDFSVPAELVAKHPLKKRDGCRLLVLEKKTGQMQHRQFSNLLEYLQPGDVLVLNDAKVNKSRFFATRPTGGKVEVLLCRPVQDFVGANRRVRPSPLRIGEGLGERSVGAGSPRPGEGISPLQKNELGFSSLSLRRRGTEGEVWEAIISHSARVKVGEFLTLNGNCRGGVAPPLGEETSPPQQNGDGFSSLSLRRRGTEGEVSCPPPRVGEGLGERSGFHIISKLENRAIVQIESDGDIFEKYGAVPIPPYLERPAEEEDEEDYQTVFARTPGASAAPTAGLHFTPELLEKIKSKGVEIAYITLLVGPGTFEPIRGDDISHHKMHAEYFEIGEGTCAKINAAKKSGKKIWAVGTTVVKALETAIRVGAGSPRPGRGNLAPTETMELHPFSGDSDLFIHPPFDFKIVDGLITNFHWPRSTLILLVAAFAGKEQILSAYNEAIAQRYRFFSYGDAMLIY